MHMRRVVRAALREGPLLWQDAVDMVGGAGTASGAAWMIRAWLEERTVFLADPVGVETIRTPRLMIQTAELEGVAEGDCDDIAVLGAALGMAIGIPARFVLLAFQDPGLYTHVYTELLTEAGPVELDTTRPAQMPEGLRIERAGFRGV